MIARTDPKMSRSRPFLTASWRNLAMVNYEVPAALLRPLVPQGTELDSWAGATLASVVGFRFLDTRVLGLPIPGHRDFDEVNLRFYVRRRAPEGWRSAGVYLRRNLRNAAGPYRRNCGSWGSDSSHVPLILEKVGHQVARAEQPRAHAGLGDAEYRGNLHAGKFFKC